MKKGFKVLCVMFVILLTTGCVKMEFGMNINKDKSMDLVITEAFANSLLEQSGEEIFSSDELEKIEDNGFKISNYSDNSMKGFTFTKTIDNIDNVSSEEEIKADISVGLDSDKDFSDKIFTVKKGFLKNTYIANLTSSDTDSVKNQVGSSSNANDENYDNIADDATADIDYSSMMGSMDMKFVINLPYAAKSNNATDVENDGKKLSWDLLNFEKENIKFEFELYNMTNIYIAGGIGALILVVVITLIIFTKKHKKNSPTMTTQSLNTLKENEVSANNESGSNINESTMGSLITPDNLNATPVNNGGINESSLNLGTSSEAIIPDSQIETLNVENPMTKSVSTTSSLEVQGETSPESLEIFNVSPGDFKQDK